LTGIKKTEIPACCGKSQIILQFDFSLELDHSKLFLEHKFLSSKSYADRGILYLEDPNLVIMGPIGSNRFTVKCKNTLCNNSILIVEEILTKIKAEHDEASLNRKKNV